MVYSKNNRITCFENPLARYLTVLPACMVVAATFGTAQMAFAEETGQTTAPEQLKTTSQLATTDVKGSEESKLKPDANKTNPGATDEKEKAAVPSKTEDIIATTNDLDQLADKEIESSDGENKQNQTTDLTIKITGEQTSNTSTVERKALQTKLTTKKIEEQTAQGNVGETKTEVATTKAQSAENKTNTTKTSGQGQSKDATEPKIEIVTKDGKIYYQVNGAVQKQSDNKLLKVGSNYYYVLVNGQVSTKERHYISDDSSNGFVKEGNYSFYSDGRLVQISGIYKKDKKNWFYQDKSWTLVLNKVVKDNNKYYLTDSTGKLYKNGNYRVSSSSAACGVPVGYYHFNSDCTMEYSSNPCVLKRALNDNMHVTAIGKDNAVTLTVYYYRLNKKITNMYVDIDSGTSKNLTLDYKNVKITKGKDGKFSVTFYGLAPNGKYSFSVTPYYSAKNKKGGTSTYYTGGGSTDAYVKTTSKNTRPVYLREAACKKMISDLQKRKSTGDFFITVSASDYAKFIKGKLSIYDLFNKKLLEDSASRLGSLLSYLKYDISKGDAWKSGNKYYVGINVKSKSTKAQVNKYNKVLKWYTAAKKKTSGKSTKNKCKILAKYLMGKCSYDWKAYYNSSIHSWAYDDEGVILHKKAVCSGYSDAFRKLCAYAGVKCEMVYSSDHAWNLVKVGKKWYHYDVTWNDCVGSQKAYSFMGSQKTAKISDHKAKFSAKFKKGHPISKTNLRW